MAFVNALGRKCKYQVSVNLIEFHPPKVNVLQALKNAQTLYGQYDIDFHFRNGYCARTPVTLEAKLNVIDMECKWDQENGDQTDLFKLANVGEKKRRVCFFRQINQNGFREFKWLCRTQAQATGSGDQRKLHTMDTGS